MWTYGNDPAIALEKDLPAGEDAVALKLSRHQSWTFSLIPLGAINRCVKSPSWTANAGFSAAPAAYAGAGLGVSWSENATKVNDRSCVGEAKVEKPKTPGACLWLISTAYEYLVSGSNPPSSTWAPSSWADRVATGTVAESRRPIP